MVCLCARKDHRKWAVWMKAYTAAVMPISQTRSQAVLCKGFDSATRFWVFYETKLLLHLLVLSVFQHCWYSHALLYIKRDPRAVFRGSIQHTYKNTVHVGNSRASRWKGGRCLAGADSFLPRVTAWVQSTSSSGLQCWAWCSHCCCCCCCAEWKGKHDSEILPRVTEFSGGWTPTEPKVRAVPACASTVSVCAWTHRYVQAGKLHKIVKHIYEVWRNMQFFQWIKDLKIKHIWQVPVPICQLGREKGDEAKVINIFSLSFPCYCLHFIAQC